jgi:hypothetical protein
MTEEDDIVTVKLPKSEALVLKDIIKEREAYNFLINRLKTYWVFTVAGGVLVVWALYEKIFPVTGVIK